MFDFKVKQINSDFLVTEVPLLPEVKSPQKSNYTYVWLSKSNYTTFRSLELISKKFNISLADVNAQGLKDEDAITSQIISLKKILTPSQVNAFNLESRKSSKTYMKIDRIIGYGKYPVQERNLHGNCFEVTIRNLELSRAEKLEELLRNHRTLSFINYYDSQRFGMPGGPYNTHLIGRSIIDNNLDKLKKELLKSNNNINVNTIKTWDNFYEQVDSRKISFFINSYNSALFNTELSSQVRFNNKSQRVEFNNLPKLYLPKTPHYLIANNIIIDGYSIKDRSVIKKTKTRLSSVQTAIYSKKIQKDRINLGKYSLTVSFYLPTGSYGTMLISQLVYWSR